MSISLWLRLAAVLPVAVVALRAHGALEFPLSRVYGCYLTSNAGAACRAAVAVGGAQAVYDWNGVNIGDAAGQHQQRIPDGRLCSANREQHKGFDLARTDWVASPVAAGPATFVFHGTAPHATRYFRFYLTREGYDPTRPLTWASLEAAPFCEPAWTVENGRFRMTCQLPRRTGRHLIYTIWQRSDSAEAFYSCSDVDFGGGTAPPPAPVWTEIGQIRAMEDFAAGTTVSLRIFDGAGRDAGAPSVVLQSGQTAAADWALALAREVNLRSGVVAVGVLQADGTVTPTRSATANAIYARVVGYRAELSVVKPAPGGGGGGAAEFVYPAGIGGYQAGTVVQGPQGGVFRCRPAPFTAWCNVASPAGVLAYAPGVGHAWRDAWEPVGAAPVPVPPLPASIPAYPNGLSAYTAGTVVRGGDGKLYRCRPFPNSGWCASPSRLHYEPGVGTAWQDAWVLVP